MVITTRIDRLHLALLRMLGNLFHTHTDPCLLLAENCPFLNITLNQNHPFLPMALHLNHQCTLPLLRDSGLLPLLIQMPTLIMKGHTHPIPRRIITTSITPLLHNTPLPQDLQEQHTPTHLLPVDTTHRELPVLVHPYRLQVKVHTHNTLTPVIPLIRLSNTLHPINNRSTLTVTMIEKDGRKTRMKILERCRDPLRPFLRT